MAKKDYTKWSKEDLIDEIKQLRKRKKYGLVWEDKPEDVVEQCKTELPVLQEIKGKEISTDPNKPVNLLIEGDNYHALSVLNYTHKGKVDVIYIDPPYNTGKKDFKYNDHWVNEDDLYKHSKWLSFIDKRLRLAKQLLKRDGIIFISIDDNEMAQLKMLCDDIFGEKNRLSTHNIQVRYGNKNLNEKKDFQEIFEYVLVYAKNSPSFKANKPTEEYNLNKFNLEIKELKEPDKILEIGGKKVEIFLKGSYSIKKQDTGNIDLFKETWLSGSIYSGTGHGKTYQKIVEGRVKTDGLATIYKIHGLGEDGLGYRYMINPQRESSTRGKMFTKVPIEKRTAIEKGESDIFRPIVNFYDFSPDFGNIRHEGGMPFNSGKKPTKMIKQFINYHKRKDVTVLDFFAGSGSTGHAVLDLNEEDGGNRKFILSTNNEDNNGDGKISEDICYPRLKNVVNGFNSQKAIGGNLKYFKTTFVPAEPTDHNKTALTKKATEMLCVKEDTFDEVKTSEQYKIFRNKNRYTGIIFDHQAIDDFKKDIADIDGKCSVYVFSLGDDTFDDEFEDVKKKVKLSPIPEAILRVYRRIFK